MKVEITGTGNDIDSKADQGLCLWPILLSRKLKLNAVISFRTREKILQKEQLLGLFS